MPLTYLGIIFENVGNWILVEAEGLGFKIYWDSQDFIYIHLNSELWKKTNGLCGTLSGNPYDDFVDTEGSKVNNGLSGFVREWSLLDEYRDYSTNHNSEHIHPCENNDLASEAQEFCNKMLLIPSLSECYKEVDPLPYYETCKWSYCIAKSNNSQAINMGCQSAESYVRACRDHNLNIEQWRSPVFCCKDNLNHG